MSDQGDPFSGAIAVTPSDSVNIAYPGNNSGRALYIGVSGDVVVVDYYGNVTTFKAHPVGYMPGKVKRVNTTNTTATNIVALF